MIIQRQIIGRQWADCNPVYFGQSNAYGLSLGLGARPTRAGNHWTWTGAVPHPTRMNHWRGLTFEQQAGWTAVAVEMRNDHSQDGVTTYTGIIAYMQTNLYRRLLGLPYSDFPPPIGIPVPPRLAVFMTGPPRFNPMAILLDP